MKLCVVAVVLVVATFVSNAACELTQAEKDEFVTAINAVRAKVPRANNMQTLVWRYARV